MSKMKKVEGSESLYRTEAGSIVNTDDRAYHSYIRKREQARKKEAVIQDLSNELKEAKEEIAELKDLIKKVLEAK